MASSVEGCEDKDVKAFLTSFFQKKDEEKISKMSDELKNLGIDVVSDFKYLNDDNLKTLQTFNDIELKKFIDRLKKFDFEPLRNSVKEIFAGFPEERLNTIINFLNAQELYTRKDLLSADTNELRKYNQLSENEFEKIEQYLEQYNKSHYDKIKENKEKKESEDLTPVLNEIFYGETTRRINAIEHFLRENKITSKKDLLNINTNNLKGQNLVFADIIKIENYLKTENNIQYNKIMKEKNFLNSKLKTALETIFDGFPMERLLEIEAILVDRGCAAEEALRNIDANELIKENILKESEMLKLMDYIKYKNKPHYDEMLKQRELELFNPEILQHVLNKIFSGASDKRIREIEKYLKDEEVYKGKDLLILNTNDLRKSHRLSESEIMKIEEYIKENNKDRYWTIKQEEQDEKDKKTYELQLRRIEYDQEYSALTQEKKQLSEGASELEIEHKQLLDKLSEVQRNQGILFGYGVNDIKRAESEVEKIEELLKRKNHKISQIENKIKELKKVTYDGI